MRLLINTLLLLFFCALSLSAQFTPASFQQGGKTMHYQVLYPDNYDSAKQYPLLVFLHGAGERGDDNQKQLTHGKEFLICNFMSKHPAIVLVPQCPADDYWSNVQRSQIGEKTTFTFGLTDEPTESMLLLMALIEHWLTSGRIDTKRVYAGGLSMGGMGTFELLWRMPHTFAAAFPICGSSSVDKLPAYAKSTAVWIFHGEVDEVVPPILSVKAYEALQALGCDVKYTAYKGVNHNSWDNVFKEETLVPWLFEHRK